MGGCSRLESLHVFVGHFKIFSTILDHLVYKKVYLLLFPSRWVKRNPSFFVLISIPQNINALQSSSVTNSQIPVSFGALVPLPNFAEDQPDSASDCESVCIEIGLVINSPISFSPESHAISHAASRVSDSGSKSFGTVKDPLSQSQRNFGKDTLLAVPVELEVLSRRVGPVLLNSVADIPKNFSFGGVVNFRVIFDLVNGP